MRYVVTGAQMKQIDQDTIQRIGIPSVVLMERAALAVAEEAKNLLSNRRDLGDFRTDFLERCREFWNSGSLRYGE